MRRLIANGTQLRPFSKEILDACYKATQEVYAELSAKNPKWKAIYEPWKKFLDDEHQWFRVAEQPCAGGNRTLESRCTLGLGRPGEQLSDRRGRDAERRLVRPLHAHECLAAC